MTALVRPSIFIALIAMIAAIVLAIGSVDHAAASEQSDLTFRGADLGDDASAQEAPSDADDDRVSVQMWTITAAVLAAAIGLLLFLVRAIMGRVKPPPPQEDHH